MSLETLYISGFNMKITLLHTSYTLFRLVTLDVLLIISNFSTACQLILIRILVYYNRLPVDC